jgi:hypothetical protein
MTRMAVLGAVVLVASLTASLAPANNASGDKSTGGVGYTTGMLSAATVSFNGHHTPHPNADAPAKGHVSWSDSLGRYFEGTVNCYNRLEDNRARFSGVIDDTNQVGRTHFEVDAEDNASPGRDGDRIRVVFRTTPAPAGCGEERPLFPVESGNLVVHHR